MNIDVNTRFVTLIGTPLAQSYAAQMQNAAYAAAGLNYCYFYTEADESHLGEILNGIRRMPSFCGCAITKPNKVAALKYLDALDPLCAKTGACNTVLRTADARLIGYNTDAVGFARSIEDDTDFRIRGSACFCLGAGGAGHAICAALVNGGASQVIIADKCEEHALALVESLRSGFGSDAARFVPYGDFSQAPECALLINATGVGMGTTVGESPYPSDAILPKHLCFDACYNPDRTQFLLDAAQKGCRVLNGLGMSLHQGAAQIEIWTGRPAPIAAMRAELQRIRSQ